MKSVFCACLVAAALAFGALRLTAADTAKFQHLVSVYADEAGVGLNLPEGVACGGDGEVVVGDTGNDRLLRFTYEDKTVSSVAVIRIPQLASPSRVHLNSRGEIFALDGRARRVVHLSAAGEFKEVLSLEAVPPPATIIAKSFAIDSGDNIYVLDVFSARVLVLDSQGKYQTALALPDDIGFASDLAVDFAGNVLLLDSIKRRVLTAGKDAKAFTRLGGDLAEVLPTLPTAITASKGAIFVVDGAGSTILGLGRDGSVLGRQLTMGWEEGFLNHPSQMCVNDKDEAFIADRDNSRVQVFKLSR